MLIEVSSVSASNKTLRKPVEIPRPKWWRNLGKSAKAVASGRPSAPAPAEASGVKSAIGVLAATTKGARQ